MIDAWLSQRLIAGLTLMIMVWEYAFAIKASLMKMATVFSVVSAFKIASKIRMEIVFA